MAIPSAAPLPVDLSCISFCKIAFPALRLGYQVLPPALPEAQIAQALAALRHAWKVQRSHVEGTFGSGILLRSTSCIPAVVAATAPVHAWC